MMKLPTHECIQMVDLLPISSRNHHLGIVTLEHILILIYCLYVSVYQEHFQCHHWWKMIAWLFHQVKHTFSDSHTRLKLLLYLLPSMIERTHKMMSPWNKVLKVKLWIVASLLQSKVVKPGPRGPHNLHNTCKPRVGDSMFHTLPWCWATVSRIVSPLCNSPTVLWWLRGHSTTNKVHAACSMTRMRFRSEHWDVWSLHTKQWHQLMHHLHHLIPLLNEFRCGIFHPVFHNFPAGGHLDTQ